jgi:hypothetical protein
MNEVKTSELFPKPVVKTGVVFGVVSAVLNLLGAIPILGIFFSLVNWLVGITAGYVVISTVGGKKENLADVIKHSALTGLIAGAIAGLGGGVASVLNNLIFTRVSFFGVYYTPGLADFIGWFIGSLIWGVVGMVIWSVVGGIIQIYYTPDKLPAGLKVQLDKIIAFIRK